MYQGYKNRETWTICLWLDNDERLYEHWKTTALECSVRAHSVDDAKRELAALMRADFEESFPDVSGLWTDLITYALAQVDWLEVADTRLDDDEWAESHALGDGEHEEERSGL